MKKTFLLLLLTLLAACKSKTDIPATIIIDKPHQTVKVAGIPLYMLNGIKQDSLTTEAWQSLFPVCTMPADTDMRNYQEPIKGKYQVNGNLLTFTPDTPFKHQQTYFARYYRYDERITSMDLVLHRRETGKATFTELIFKY